jgi:CheY-like chemotaxis protein
MSTAPAYHGDARPVVLLVEDHVDTRQMYAEFLCTTFEIIEAGDGDEAVQMMRTRRPDLLITDLSLPRLDGFELIAMIRSDAELRHVPVICLSGYGGHAHEARARAAGCDRVLQKPCMPDALADAAMEVLQQSRNPRA